MQVCGRRECELLFASEYTNLFMSVRSLNEGGRDACRNADDWRPAVTEFACRTKACKEDGGLGVNKRRAN